MDQHDTKGAVPTDLAAAHAMDLALENEYNVRFLTYWLDYARGVANCLVEAPNPDVVNEVHGLSHGMLANRIIPVDRSEVAAILGRLTDPDDGAVDESAARTFVFTDMVGSTALLESLGDEAAVEILRNHDRMVRTLLDSHGGREVKHTGDGFMLAFTSPTEALKFSISLQRGLSERGIAIRIGLNTGTPVAEGQDFFGMAVNVAARLCELAGAGEILASENVVGEATNSEFGFTQVGPTQLRGRTSPVAVYRLDYAR